MAVANYPLSPVHAHMGSVAAEIAGSTAAAWQGEGD